MNKKKHSFSKAAIAFAVFVLYTALIKFIDVAPAGESGAEVGFSKLNGAFFNMFPKNELFYKLTQYCGYLALLVCMAFALLGLVQLVKGKSLWAVDPRIITMGIYFVIVILCYVAFEFIVINCRPVLMDGELEASYPSSHTMLALTVSAAVMQYFGKSHIERSKKGYINAAGFAFMLVVIMGRLLSGVHWLTDIVGAIILSVAIMNLFIPLYDRVKLFVESRK